MTISPLDFFKGSFFKPAVRLMTTLSGLLTLVILVGLATLFPAHLAAQSELLETETVATSTASPLEKVEVDWLEQIQAGGLTMLILAVVSLFALAFTVERAFVIRRKYFCPRDLSEQARTLIAHRDFDALYVLGKKYPSTLGRIICFLVEHRDNEYSKVSAMAENLGAREIIDQEERTFPLAVVAAVAPLLGLLGTMIGMIEAFQLVSIYGDEGGASMLAGSIAKALITTAAGLSLAIPAIGAFHYFKHKVHKIGVQLDTSLEELLTGLFLEKAELNSEAQTEIASDTDA
ncbi:MotA/TolQ/ExbB proton channel family protein [Kiritimatiellota bacterium B12222]|nr:MotA/TolQ/ExbB proton channel family protein [Kiritimatiellota bacterium B12222]